MHVAPPGYGAGSMNREYGKHIESTHGSGQYKDIMQGESFAKSITEFELLYFWGILVQVFPGRGRGGFGPNPMMGGHMGHPQMMGAPNGMMGGRGGPGGGMQSMGFMGNGGGMGMQMGNHMLGGRGMGMAGMPTPFTMQGENGIRG